eukprot:m.322045 g.322045  ORF g.322045 m.322045 type:complete len:279 (+) comp20346_c0_seq1:281-1117(+)
MTSLALSSVVSLRNGVDMPLIGLGLSHNGGYSDDAVATALKIGIRHFDTAQRYGSEPHLGRILAECGIPRNELFITTKVWRDNYDEDRFTSSVHQSLAALKTEYVDLLLLHWPGHRDGQHGRSAVWKLMEQAYAQGLAKAIGVSNFLPAHLDQLQKTAKVMPHVNQCEYNPLQQSPAITAACQAHGILFTGYCPLAKGHALTQEIIQDIAAQKKKTAAQILIRWCLQKGVPVIPKSIKPPRVAENADVFDFELDGRDMQSLDTLHCDFRATWDPTGVL